MERDFYEIKIKKKLDQLWKNHEFGFESSI